MRLFYSIILLTALMYNSFPQENTIDSVSRARSVQVPWALKIENGFVLHNMLNQDFVDNNISSMMIVSLYYDQYDGPSYKDQQAANAFNTPVYSIGPTTVSVIFPHEGHSEDYYRNLSFGDYNFHETRYDVNPFYISEQSTWLENPYFYEYW